MVNDPNPNAHDEQQPQPIEQQHAAILPVCGESMMTGEWAVIDDDIPDRQPTSTEEEK